MYQVHCEMSGGTLHYTLTMSATRPSAGLGYAKSTRIVKSNVLMLTAGAHDPCGCILSVSKHMRPSLSMLGYDDMITTFKSLVGVTLLTSLTHITHSHHSLTSLTHITHITHVTHITSHHSHPITHITVHVSLYITLHHITSHHHMNIY